MKFALSPMSAFALAGLLAVASAGALAEGPTTTEPAARSGAAGSQGGHRMMGPHDPAAMQAGMARRQADMKARLGITADQEAAWTSFATAMQPPVRPMPAGQPMAGQRAELDRLTTPERVDKMRALRTERMAQMQAEMDKRGEATKAFYAALRPDQKTVFDAEHKLRGGSHYGGHHGGMGHSKS